MAKMPKGVSMLYSGNFNTMMQERDSTGNLHITISKDGDNKEYSFDVIDLYGENEVISNYKVITSNIPNFIKERMDEARKNEGFSTPNHK